MDVRIVSVDPDYSFRAKSGKSISCILLKAEKLEDGEAKEWRVFHNHALADTVKRLQPGATVSIGFVKDGKFWNMDSISPLTNTGGGGGGSASNSSKDEQIARAVALKAAIELLGATKITDVEAAAIKAIEIAPMFIPYLLDIDVEMPTGGDEEEPF